MQRMKSKFIVLALALCLVVSSVSLVSAASDTLILSDIAGNWAEEDIQAYVELGYLNGYPDGTFRPENQMTRAEFAKVINLAMGYTTKSDDIYEYEDVNEDAWYYDALAIALDAGYMIGTSETTMDPDSYVTKEQAFIMVNRIIGMPEGDSSYLNSFISESPNTSAYLTRAEGVKLLRATENMVVMGSSIYLVYTSAVPGATRVGDSDVYYEILTGEEITGEVFGVSDLYYSEFYSGDVSSTESYDAVTTATVDMYNSFSRSMMISNVPEEDDDGYQILGVRNVSVKVDADFYVPAKLLSAAGAELTEAQTVAARITLNSDPYAEVPQYKTLSSDGTYSATSFNVADVVTDAQAVLKTGTTWGDYEIDVTDDTNNYIRNTRSDEGFVINSTIQGLILVAETADGEELAVGLEYMQSMWIQPWECSFNVTQESTNNAHIEGWDNIPELAKLVNSTVYQIIYVMPDCIYVYQFDDGIYIKPSYSGDATVVASFSEGSDKVIISGIPEEMENVTITIKYGSGRNATTVCDSEPVVNGVVTMSEVYDPENTYTVTLQCSQYADIVVDGSISAEQIEQLKDLIAQAEKYLDDDVILEHYNEAVEMLELAENGLGNSSDASTLISDLEGHLAAV